VSALLATGMVAASGLHLALGCGRWSSRTALRLTAEAAMLAAMLDACVLHTDVVSARTWTGSLLVLAAVVLAWPDREANDHWHASALVLVAGLLAVPHHAMPHHAMAMDGAAGPATLPYLVTAGVAVYVAYAALLGLGADRGRLAPRDGRGRSQVAVSAVGLLCMTVLMSS
jgi:hypothetical protein